MHNETGCADQRDLRFIALHTSDDGSIALAISRYLRQSVSPLSAPIIAAISARVHPRNRHTRTAGSVFGERCSMTSGVIGARV